MTTGVLGARLLLWALATIGHFMLTRHWLRRLRRDRPGADDLWFDVVLAGTGSLAVVLHVVAAVTGLGLAAVIGGLALWHGAVAIAVAASGASSGTQPAARPAGDDRRGPVLLDVAAMAVLIAIGLGWADASTRSLAISGADAAHYHVPVAVNLALGASPLDLPPTQHLYPMVTSTLAAWFIVPTGDLLLVDLTMLLPFLLLTASIALLFRLATGASGIGWTTWLALALFATPMFRASSLMSADLLFAAAFAAALAHGVRMWRRPADATDVLLAGLALGLLAGSKATGIPSAALLVAAWVVLVAATHRGRWRDATGSPAMWVPAALLALGAGGIWLARNWLLFGSPIAPNGLTLFGVEIFTGPAFEATTYLSALGDVRNADGYSLAGRVRHFAAVWFGPAFLPLLLVALLVPVDAAVAWYRGRGSNAATKLVALGLTVAAGVPLVWMLVGAPWTSLEWTAGYSLRYALPLAVLLPLFAVIALFPASWRWYEQPGPAAVVGFAVAGLSTWLFVGAQAGSSALDPPRLSAVTMVASATVVAIAMALRHVGRRAGAIAALAGAALAAGAFAAAVAGRDPGARARAGEAPRPATPAVAVQEAVAAAERQPGPACDRRRYFVLTRLDDPLALQSGATLDAQVFYAARDVESARRAGPLRECDYVIASRPVLETEKGAALLGALYPSSRTTEITDTGRFVVLAAR